MERIKNKWYILNTKSIKQASLWGVLDADGGGAGNGLVVVG
jgi:hypothetical protein